MTSTRQSAKKQEPQYINYLELNSANSLNETGSQVLPEASEGIIARPTPQFQLCKIPNRTNQLSEAIPKHLIYRTQ